MSQSSRKAGRSVSADGPFVEAIEATSDAARKKRSTESVSLLRRRREEGRLCVKPAGEVDRMERVVKATSSKQEALWGSDATTRAWRSSHVRSVLAGELRMWRTAVRVEQRDAWCVSASSDTSKGGVNFASAAPSVGRVANSSSNPLSDAVCVSKDALSGEHGSREREEREHMTSTRNERPRKREVATRWTCVRRRGRWRNGERGRLEKRSVDVSRRPISGERVERSVPMKVWRGSDSLTRAKKGREEGREGGKEGRMGDCDGERGRREEEEDNTRWRNPFLSISQCDR